MEIQIAVINPFIYAATLFFAISALSSDLLFIRFALTNGFLFLVLASLSSHSSDGSFPKETMPFINGTIDITAIINACLFLLNLIICIRLINDEWPKKKLNEEEEALFRFFHCRCGLNRLQYDEILSKGHFLELNSHEDVPCAESTLYLVLQGQVECQVQFRENTEQKQCFIKRSGQFFDIKLFNIFKLPIGFDSISFEAKTLTRTKLFGWTVQELIHMRNLQSPNLLPFWEYMVLGSLAGAAIRHHLDDTKTLFDSAFIPEEIEWLDGAPSRDFAKKDVSTSSTGSSETCWQHWKRELCQIGTSLMNIIPPKGIRHPHPSLVLRNIPRQDAIEMMARAKLYLEDRGINESKERKGFFFIRRDEDESIVYGVDAS